MKISQLRIFLFFCVIIPLGFALSGCRKAPVNGNLDGMWEVNEVVRLGESFVPTGRIFYNFSLDVCQLTYYGAGATFAFGIIKYHDDNLMIDFPYIEGENAVETLKDYGVFSNPVLFKVSFPDKTHLILSDDETYVYLTKF